MKDQVAVILDPQEWEEAADRARMHFANKSHFSQGMGKSARMLDNYLEVGSSESVIPISVLNRVLNTVNSSEPMVDIGKSPSYYCRPRPHSNVRGIEIPERVQQFVFQPYQTVELGKKAGKSKQMGSRYQKAQDRPPQELFEECLEENQAAMEEELRLTGDIIYYPGKSHRDRENSVIIRDADVDEIRSAAKAECGFRNYHDISWKQLIAIKNNVEAIQNLRDLNEDPLKNYFKRDQIGSDSSPFYETMKDHGVLSLWGEKGSQYVIDADQTYLDVFNELVQRNYG